MFAEFLHWYPGYTEESLMCMSARRFFLLYKQIKRLRARESYESWRVVNWNNFNREFQDKTLNNIRDTAFPGSKDGGGAEPYWKNPQPGLRLVSK
jgi:hypothetical protein